MDAVDARVDEKADLVAADIRVLIEAREEGEPVHLHRDLARLEGVEAFRHVGVAHAGRRAALIEFLVELEPLDRAGRVDEAVHLVGLLGIVVFEAVIVHHIGDAHGDAFRAALGEDIGAIDLLAVDFAALKELGDLLELVIGLRRREIAAVFLLELGLDLRP